ncbi:UBX domain-containing protein 5 [Madurella mycetomatis]|uniref:UBX domain-containing protein 5 n=1 Tax=Madurella mycetomatis TaxID=100816 RepID=A0A175VWS5_9PEZI|nr:UBX domain-containing protein 5 [Madurella mycetomatis]
MADADAAESFMGITGANRTAAERMLELCGSDLAQAVQLWYTDEDLQRSLTNAGSSTAAVGTSASARRSSRPNRPQVGREDAQGVIHIDSDDDVPMTEDESVGQFDDPDDASEAVNVARAAQEEEDAAMAKRLQEELYSGQPADEGGVRAPMARTTETLVEPAYGSADDGDHVAMLNYLRRSRQPRGPANNPFAQSVWDDNASAARPAPRTGSQPSRSSRLAELFRPPYDLISHLPWDEAREEGKEKKKWIIVNLQDMSDFNCQALNRDLWKDEAVNALIKEHFIFLQYEKNDVAAEQYITFYFPNEAHQNPSNYPHVSIIDPRTGEQVKVWSGIPFPTALEFYAQLAEFLDRYSLAAHSKNPVSKAKRPERVVDVDRMTEEEMLEMALQNSLDTNGGLSRPNVHDPDELTKSTGDLAAGKGKQKADAEEPAVTSSAAAAATPAQTSTFAGIPSDRPHTEPPADPKTTTRLQVRNPPGRIIRRFRLDDPVSRIYEWLKAEPLPGKEGVEFELKSMPQGNDLIEHLGETIQEAGLANGTVMLEFIEEEGGAPQ